jgi:hypothetical protein
VNFWDLVDYLLAALRLAAQRAFMASESFFLPAAVSPPFFLAGPLATGAAPLRWAQRALAAAASFARVAADIGLRLREPLLFDVEGLEAVKPPPVKSEDNRRSSVLIWFLIERASVSLDRDKSMGSSITQPKITASEIPR